MSNNSESTTVDPTIHNPASSTQQQAAPNIDSGLACLIMLARFHHVAADPEQILHEAALQGERFNTHELLLAAKRLALKAKSLSVTFEKLDKIPLPAIVEATDAQGHPQYFILAKVEQGKYLIQSPLVGRPELLTEEQFKAVWQGKLILLTPKDSLSSVLGKFDLSWFIPSVIKYRKLLIEVLIVSFILQLFALITPLFFQVVMDKVLVHRALTTLDVIAIGLTVIVVFDVVLNTLRSYIFAHTTSRIDVELGAKVFRHLLALPLNYFQARRVGDSVARIRELENIRSFLTGNALTLILDLVFSFVFIAVMAYYSGWLTLIVVASIPCYLLLSFIFTPILRRRLNEKFARGAENQAFLVETVTGVDTVKAMATENHWIRKWDNQLAGYVKSSFRTTTLGNFANSGVMLINKLVTVAIMFFGAKLVIEGKLTVGQLVAFNMLAGQVSQPVMRLAQMWTDFQQVDISIQRLGDILNTKTELSDSKGSLPKIAGHITLDHVFFRYRPDGQEILKDIHLNIQAGEVIGIVGRSGSGKSTLTKLIQRLYVPERGRILIDGMDLSIMDTSSLRRQIGVVLQENMLFNRSIRDNIALSEPSASLERVIEVAKLAGAHDFIVELPEGYNTMVGEHGSTLSGGQRQRVAIARALITNPRILIFDEATSALDYESEHIIQSNMQTICRGRTVLIIAHRLSAVKNANRIVVMEQGRVIETGSHHNLLQLKDGIYAKLHQLQHG